MVGAPAGGKLVDGGLPRRSEYITLLYTDHSCGSDCLFIGCLGPVPPVPFVAGSVAQFQPLWLVTWILLGIEGKGS